MEHSYLLSLDLEKTAKFDTEKHCFQDFIEASDIDNMSTKEMVERFFHSFFAGVNCLYEMDGELYHRYVLLYNREWRDELSSVFAQENLDDFDKGRLLKVFLHYDILLEQAVCENNVDSLMNILIDIPKGFCGKLKNTVQK